MSQFNFCRNCKGGDFIKTDSQSRKWQLTINNPAENGFSHEVIKEKLAKFKSCIYWCMSDEVGQEGTYHTHVYICCKSALRFSTIKKQFDKAHIEMCKGTSQENKDYVFKQGKWLGSTKEDTNLKDTHEEFGECPVERQGARNDLADLYDMIKEGMSNYQIIENNPEYLFNIDKIERARTMILTEKYRKEWRDLEVIYIYGVTGKGKTRGVMDKYGYENVYRVTDYEHPFDGYQCQDVLVFEEFRSSFKIQDMLNYLDGYPLLLPCRYSNKVACFTKVYIISNISLAEQYENIQEKWSSTFDAFLRRINKVIQYTDNDIIEKSVEQEIFPF